MKARIIEIKPECVLSVGMIVKNEEKYLEKCLSALKPLLDAVSSELIIVDTGSTDKTVEIAGRFTDKVYRFNWVNDFSAARNFGLEKCGGEWFMYLDADDIFDEDLSEMLDFFGDAETRKKYNGASYITKDYDKPDGSEWSKFTQNRIIKRYPGLRFIHPIHECFADFPQPHRRFKTFAHHWGYAYDTEEQKNEKTRRNLTLLYKELKKRPDDLRVNNHILNELEGEEKERFITETLKKAKKQVNARFAPAVFLKAVIYHFEKGDFNRTLSLAREFFKLFKVRGADVVWLDVCVCEGAALQKLGRNEEAIEAFEQYFKYYDLYAEGRLDLSGLGTMALTYCEEEEYQKIRVKYDALRFAAATGDVVRFDRPVKVVIQNGAVVSTELLEDAAPPENIILSVGMIVKNEEKYLEKCLLALKPLLDAVSSELIIVDTGSTDKTVEIAGRFTDKVYRFDWVDDFSAARNFGLEKCVGEWFMYLDADDIFDEDLSEMLGFFGDAETRKKYNGASYITRDYTKPDGSEWSKFPQNRIIKTFPGLRFIYPIHEGFSSFPAPQYHFKTFARHWGYAYENAEQREAKRRRNLPLLYKELEKNPDDLRVYVHILSEVDDGERERIFPEVLEKARKQAGSNLNYAPAVFARAILYYYEKKGDYEKALSLIDEYFTIFEGGTENVLVLDIYVCKGAILQSRGKNEEAVEAFGQYFKYYGLYAENKLDLTGLGTIATTFTEPEGYEKIERIYKILLSATGGKAAPPSSEDIILSVGMIVKNEEKYLEKCLLALKPLLDAVSSELIIVDTGSTDKTVEIAERFTDKVYRFDWVDDFSAARNFGLEKCGGEWFMFLDADEIFDEDLSEMLSFFGDAETRKKYNGAVYIRRNYTNPGGTEFSKSAKSHIVRRFKGLRFVNPIHEALSDCPAPQYRFNTFTHHWGYAFDSEEQKEAKRKRNLTLLYRELEEKPGDLRTLLHIYKDLNDGEIRGFLPGLLQKARERKNDPQAAAAFIDAILFHYTKDEFDAALGYINEYFKLFRADSALSLDVFVCKGACFQQKGEYGEAVKAYGRYLEYYKLYKEDKLDLAGFGALPLVFTEPEGYEKIRKRYEALLSATGLTPAPAPPEDIILSVGMIVKNEEKYLEKCLLALKPLLDAVSSELIIVDTGSTDKTVEIAGRFTDKVYRFDWADDFSAARNFGLEKCGGEWFMFLDADEIFDEDLSEMSGFFGDAETRKKYNSASYVVKNLIGAGDSYDFAPRRIGRRSGNLRFVGSVHENLTPLSPPRYDFKTFATHYGYLYDDEKRREQKKERNLSLLLRELENTPDSVRLLYQILPGMSGDERAEYLDRALKAARKINTNFSAPVFLTAIRDATSGGDHAKALSLAVEYTDRFKKKDVLLIDLCRLKADALISLERYGEALAVFDEYFEYCELNGEGKLDREPLNAICVEYSSEEKLSAAKARYCETLINAGDYPKAAEYIRDNFLSFEAERINDVIEALKNRLCDYADATLSYCLPEYFDGDAGALYWAVTAFSGALISANSIPPKDRALLYERFAHFTALYVANVYNPDLLNDSDVSSLPELVRFGYYASLARNGDASAYEAAASECASYAEAIGALSGKSV